MAETTLRNCRVLLVEDEYMLADELSNALFQAGAIVLGPVGTLDEAIALIHSEQAIDGAILDVNLGGAMAFDAADLLIARDVPLVFTAGYDLSALPQRFVDIPRCEKPVNIRAVADAIGREIHA